MSNLYKALLRHPELLTSNSCVLGCEYEFTAEWLQHIKEQNVQLFTWDWQTQQAYLSNNIACQFGTPMPDDFSETTPILLWPKSKELGQKLLTMLATKTQHCYVIATNDNGGKSIGNAVKDLAETSQKIDSARHCALWQLELKQNDTPYNWLKFAKSFQFEQQSYMTLPGVFNHGKLDTGTEILLEHLPAPKHGRILDLGCGSGVIGLSMKARNANLDLTLADSDALALRSSQLNSMRLGLEADIKATNGLGDISGRYDYIYTNPPFHQGKQTDYRFAEKLLAEASQHLTKQGQLWIIANRHLAYEEWAKEAFNQVETLVQTRGFKLICAYNS